LNKPNSKFRLLFGPYHPPRVRVGGRWFCEVYGSVIVSGFSNTDFPWPKAKQDGNGRPPLILCGDLVKAERAESEVAVARHWHVSINKVRVWRRPLGVPRVNDGSLKLLQRIAAARDDDRLERARKNSKSVCEKPTFGIIWRHGKESLPQ
jgi:hypothetical protein